MTDSVDRLAIATPTDERTDELRTVGEIQPSLTSSDARPRIPKDHIEHSWTDWASYYRLDGSFLWGRHCRYCFEREWSEHP